MKKIDIKAYFNNVTKEKSKQVFLFVLACLLFAIGFINYTAKEPESNDGIAIVENRNEESLGDVELVSSESIVENEISSNGVIVENDEELNKNTDNNNDYFENVRIERDSMYSRMLETYNKMIDNEKLVETQKAIAIQEIEKITNDQNAIMICENLIKNKGFEDVVVFSNSDVINVVVKAAVLNEEDIGKIQNIIEREFKVSLENVNISNKN